MRTMIRNAWHRLDRDQGGNVAVLFAFSAIPLIGLLGGAVDVTRYTRHKTEILNAMDAAAVALVRRGAADDADADRFVNDFIAATLPQYAPARTAARAAVKPSRDTMLQLAAFDATRIAGGYRVTANGAMRTAFMPLVGIPEMPLNLLSEVLMSTRKYEVALALDNTGSMADRGKIEDLREAAGTLVNTLYEKPGAEDSVKMALVPFVTAVNIRGEAFDPAWLNRTGTGAHALDNFDRPIDRLSLFAALDDGMLGPDGLPKSWKGCVEARDDRYDLDDTSPDAGDVATRWTPYLWPDDSDVRGPGPYSYNNDYIKDGLSRGSALERLRNVDKYFTPIRTAAFGTARGPNKSCAGPIVELTADTDRMQDAIEAMKPHPGSGTNIAQGLTWGWRVLSPEAPFDQGAAYDDPETQKVLVLLSDGKNEIGGDYTAYGHLADGRLGKDVGSAVAQMNRNVETACRSVKEQNIRLYMILFQVNDAKTQKIFEDCASVHDGKTLYYYAPDGEALRLAFEEIGKDMTSIAIAR